MRREWLSLRQVAELLQVDVDTVLGWTTGGRLQAYRFDDVVRYRASDVEGLAEPVTPDEVRGGTGRSMVREHSRPLSPPPPRSRRWRGPRVWEMIREASEALKPPFRNRDITDWVLARYPDTNPSTLQCQISASTVNQQSRVQWPDNQKPRRCGDHRLDILFQLGRGLREPYDPKRHGVWRIDRDRSGELVVRKERPDKT